MDGKKRGGHGKSSSQTAEYPKLPIERWNFPPTSDAVITTLAQRFCAIGTQVDR